MARNLRWLHDHALLGISLEALGRGEADPVSARTVQRGIEAAQRYAAEKLRSKSRSDDETDDERAERLQRNLMRRRKAAKSSEN